MAGKRPGMITGANAKITVGDTTLAYASDVSYNLAIDHIPVEVMNKYEVITNVPVSMSLSGSFTVVRYTREDSVKKKIKDPDTGEEKEIDTWTIGANGNSPNEWKQDGENLKPFSPGDLLASKTFDITIFQRYVTGTGTSITEADVKFLKFKDCRITGRSASLNKRSVMSERFDFVGVSMDDDKITSASSGDTDLT